MQGNASKHKAMSWGHANKLEQQLEGEVKKLLELAQQADQEAEAEQQELDIRCSVERNGWQRSGSASARKSGTRRSERSRSEAEATRAQQRLSKNVGGKPPKEPDSRTERLP